MGFVERAPAADDHPVRRNPRAGPQHHDVIHLKIGSRDFRD
jgi:hypothetical protein